MPKPERPLTTDHLAERQRRHDLLRRLSDRHQQSLAILTAYDRGEVPRPRAEDRSHAAQRDATSPAVRPVAVSDDALRELLIEDVIDAYAIFLDCPVERAWTDLRDPGRLQAALARPGMYGHYRDADLVLRAVALLHGIAEGQPFLDGNKRMGELALVAFLALNGYVLDLAIETDLAAWILDLSDGLTVEALADLLRPWLVPTR